jgi:hypothetical protein
MRTYYPKNYGYSTPEAPRMCMGSARKRYLQCYQDCKKECEK